jgi:four helix bundle protein
VAWQQAMRVVKAGYALAKRFPNHETYGLARQLRRAVVSVASNIAEGHGRAHRGEYCYHLSVAYGELMEAETEVLVGIQEEYCTAEESKEFMAEASRAGQLINGLARALDPSGRYRAAERGPRTPVPGPRTP